MPTKRPILLYSLLAASFCHYSLLYQVRYLPDLFHRETVHFPFFFVDPGSDTINFTTPEAASFGIHNGDHLVAVNGTLLPEPASWVRLSTGPGRVFLWW